MVTAFEYVEDCNRKVLNYGWIEFPLAYTQVWWLDEGEAVQTKCTLIQVGLAPKFPFEKGSLTTGCNLLCLRLLRRRPLWSPVSWTARRTQVSAVAFYILLHLLRIGSLSIDRCNQFSNNCRSISSDDTTFPAVPNINFAASGPFANHTPGETELSLDFIFSEDKSAASQDK